MVLRMIIDGAKIYIFIENDKYLNAFICCLVVLLYFCKIVPLFDKVE